VTRVKHILAQLDGSWCVSCSRGSRGTWPQCPQGADICGALAMSTSAWAHGTAVCALLQQSVTCLADELGCLSLCCPAREAPACIDTHLVLCHHAFVRGRSTRCYIRTLEMSGSLSRPKAGCQPATLRLPTCQRCGKRAVSAGAASSSTSSWKQLDAALANVRAAPSIQVLSEVACAWFMTLKI
jgi:hypothetical protein